MMVVPIGKARSTCVNWFYCLPAIEYAHLEDGTMCSDCDRFATTFDLTEGNILRIWI